jgi:hypothetical protein
MDNKQDSVIKARINELQAENYIPEKVRHAYDELRQLTGDKDKERALLDNLIKEWQKELLESYQCVDKLQTTINDYENDLILMMDQMDALVKCSLLIKQYSLYLKQEIDKVADKVDKQGFDERLDHLVSLLDDLKPKKHLNLVRQADIVEFPKKQ